MSVVLQVAPAVTPKKGAFKSTRGRRAGIQVNHSQEETMEVDSELRTPGPQSRRENSEGHNGYGGDIKLSENGGGHFERDIERLHTQFDNHKQYHPRGMSSAATEPCHQDATPEPNPSRISQPQPPHLLAENCRALMFSVCAVQDPGLRARIER